MPPILMARAGLLAKAERGLSDRRKFWTGDHVKGFVKVMEAELALARGNSPEPFLSFKKVCH